MAAGDQWRVHLLHVRIWTSAHMDGTSTKFNCEDLNAAAYVFIFVAKSGCHHRKKL